MLKYNSSRRGDYDKHDSSNNFDSSNKLDSSRKQDVSSKTGSSNNFDSSNKHHSSRKQDRSNKQVRSSKQNSSINLKNVDPDCLMEKFTELYNSKYASNEEVQVARERGKEVLNEILRVKAITKRQYTSLYKKCDE